MLFVCLSERVHGDFSPWLLGMCSFGKSENCFWPVQYSVCGGHAHTHTLALMPVGRTRGENLVLLFGVPSTLLAWS